ALVPVVGRLADIVGRKRLYVAGFAVFTLGSLLAGVAQPKFHGWDLVIYRVVQGVGGALLITRSRALVAAAFRHGGVGLRRGVNQVAGAAGFLLGPVVGGLLTAISWRWVFLINVPLGIFGTLWGIWRLREPVRLPAHQRFDWWGSLTFVVGLGSLLLALSLIAFPMLPMPVVNALFGVGVLGLAGFLVAGPLSGYLSDHSGSRLLSRIGLLVSAVGLFGLSTVTASSPYWILAIYMVLMGGGSGLFSSPNVNALMSTVPPQQRGVASG